MVRLDTGENSAMNVWCSWRRVDNVSRCAGYKRALTIGRRELLVALGGVAAAWPIAARAQQVAMPVIGFLEPRSSDDTVPRTLLRAFRQGLRGTGHVEGENVSGRRTKTIDCRHWRP